MRRSRLSRLFAALFAPWFAFVVAEPVPLHDCPVHSLHPVAVQTAEATHESSSMDAGMPQMAHRGTASEGATHTHGAHGHAGHHQCCCLGACCASAPAALTRTPQLGQLPALTLLEPAYSTAESFVATAVEHVLPFANGPPATLA